MLRSSKNLGASARKGERTGAIEIDYGEMSKAAQKVVDAFRSCGEGLKKPAKGPVVSLDVVDPSTGKKRPVDVFAIPSTGTKSAMTGEYSLLRYPDGSQMDRVVLYPKSELCMSPDEWKYYARMVLTHELTHASDPWLHRRPVEGPKRSGGCAYASFPAEVAAFLSETREDLRSFYGVRKAEKLRKMGKLRQPSDLLRYSHIYQLFQHCWTPETKRRFMRMAALEWANRGW